MRSLIFAVCVGLSLLACEVAMGSSAVGGEVVFSVTLNAAVPPEMQRVGDGYTEHVDKGCLKAEIDPQRTLLCKSGLLGGQAHALLGAADFDGATDAYPVLRARRVFRMEGVVFSRVYPWGNRVAFQRCSMQTNEHAKSEIARGRLPVILDAEMHLNSGVTRLNFYRHIVNPKVGAHLSFTNCAVVLNRGSGLTEGYEQGEQANNADTRPGGAHQQESESPACHILLGGQVIFGCLGACLGIAGVRDALRRFRSRDRVVFEADVQLLLGCLLVGGSYLLALLAVFQLVPL